MTSVERVGAMDGEAGHAATWPGQRRLIRQHLRLPEHEGVAQLLDAWKGTDDQYRQARERASAWVQALRAAGAGASGVAALMHEFSLSSEEGVALMCLAEALARIPDRDTAYALILDKVEGRDWSAHLGGGRPLFIHAAVWGLILTGRLAATHPDAALGGALTSALRRGGRAALVAAVGFAVQLLGEQFVLGQTIDEALARARDAAARGYRHSYDMLGEAALCEADALRYRQAYQHAIQRIARAHPSRATRAVDFLARPGISVKLSALHARFAWGQGPRVQRELYPVLLDLCERAAKANLGLTIDAEEADRLEPTLDLLARLVAEPALAGWQGLGLAVQAYQKRAPAVIDALATLARGSQRQLMVRLVKGAYWDAEIKRAQIDGLADFPVWTRKVHTDLSYLVCAQRLIEAADTLVPQFATHNALTIAQIEAMAQRAGTTRYEFQCLHGMGEALYDLRRESPGASRAGCRIYAPVGTHETLLAYLVRRLLENGANVSFVHRLYDASVSDDELLADPVQVARHGAGVAHGRVRHPLALFEPDRSNSAGVDLADRHEVLALRLALLRGDDTPVSARPQGMGMPGMQAFGLGFQAEVTGQARYCPARLDRRLGTCQRAEAADIELALSTAAVSPWGRAPAFVRAEVLDRSAQAIEDHRDDLVALLVREAGKCLGDAVAEVREAADFCRYYALQLRDAKPWDDCDDRAWQGVGVTVAISPWNFPLAIFTGQIMAALAAGCPVVAKPAEQTPLIASAVTRILYRAGVPDHALFVLPGAGDVGEALVRDDRVRAVLFTGSTAVAQRIDQVLAERFDRGDCVLVAETGGQNAMIVDASALPEQVVQDAIHSAFNSAGQRCSALRVLCVQQEIAPRVTELLIGAMHELRCGEPARLDTDLGPLIDATAQEQVEAAVRAAGKRLLARASVAAADQARGHFAAPALIGIHSLADLGEEIFGPVLHLMSFRGTELDALIDSINRSGYGLTCGIHSRIDEHIARVADGIRAGNVYVNRNITGAVVGVQPFGGEGLSGTGPKAGGPWMLRRLRCRRDGASSDSPTGTGAPPRPEAFAALLAWWRSQGQRARAERCEAWLGALRTAPIELAGPTGERNRLRYRARRQVACVAEARAGDLDADRREALLEQVACCLAVGSAAIVDRHDAAVVQEALPPSVLSAWHATDLHAALAKGTAAHAVPAGATATPHAPDAVLYRGSPEGLTRLRRQLATRPGARIALIAGDDTHGYPLWRLFTEQSVCINTAAAGGNAELINLEA